MELTEEELFMAKKMGFQVKVFELLKNESQNSIFQFPIFNKDNTELILSENAIFSDIINNDSSLNHIQKWLKGSNYFAFLSKFRNQESNQITILKTKSQFNILEFQQTDGGNYGLSTSNIIEKLTLWDKLFGVSIIGANYCSVLFEIKKMPKDVIWFSQELFEFCPDIINQGFENIEMLIEYLKKNNQILLWWD